MTPEQAKRLKAIYDNLEIGPWRYKGKGEPRDTYDYLRTAARDVSALKAQVAGLSAAVQALAGKVGDDVDTAAVVAAVQQAIADAVIDVDVAVTSPNS